MNYMVRGIFTRAAKELMARSGSRPCFLLALAYMLWRNLSCNICCNVDGKREIDRPKHVFVSFAESKISSGLVLFRSVSFFSGRLWHCGRTNSHTTRWSCHAAGQGGHPPCWMVAEYKKTHMTNPAGPLSCSVLQAIQAGKSSGPWWTWTEGCYFHCHTRGNYVYLILQVTMIYCVTFLCNVLYVILCMYACNVM